MNVEHVIPLLAEWFHREALASWREVPGQPLGLRLIVQSGPVPECALHAARAVLATPEMVAWVQTIHPIFWCPHRVARGVWGAVTRAGIQYTDGDSSDNQYKHLRTGNPPSGGRYTEYGYHTGEEGQVVYCWPDNMIAWGGE